MDLPPSSDPAPKSTVQPQPQSGAPDVTSRPQPGPSPSTFDRPGGNDQGSSERPVHPQNTPIERPFLSSSYDWSGVHIPPRPIQEHAYYANLGRGRAPPPLPSSFHHYRSGVPMLGEIESEYIQRSIQERLDATISDAEAYRIKFSRKAYWYAIFINGALLLQVILGALTTALAASVTSLKQGQIATIVFGALSTLVASSLARVRGSGEPELSLERKRKLDAFLREAKGFAFDHGHEYCKSEDTFDHRIYELRNNFETLLKQLSGEKKQKPTKNTKSNAPNTANLTNAAAHR